MKRSYKSIRLIYHLKIIIINLTENFSLSKKENKNLTSLKKIGVCSIVILILIIGININEVFASNLKKVPIISGIINIIDFTNYKIESINKNGNISIPKIVGLTNKELEFTLNKEFEKEGKELFNKIINNKGKIYISSDYDIIVNNNKYMVLKIATEEIEASGYNTVKYYTIDKKNNTVLSLKGIFAGKNYIDVISENIKEQMKNEMKKDPQKIYFIDDESINFDNFTKIKENQNFYINTKGELVISFNEYEVSPGYMGIVEFTIPNDVINNIK